MFVEVASHLALTDFGTGKDYAAGVRVPLAVGMSFQDLVAIRAGDGEAPRSGVRA